MKASFQQSLLLSLTLGISALKFQSPWQEYPSTTSRVRVSMGFIYEETANSHDCRRELGINSLFWLTVRNQLPSTWITQSAWWVVARWSRTSRGHHACRYSWSNVIRTRVSFQFSVESNTTFGRMGPTRPLSIGTTLALWNSQNFTPMTQNCKFF